MQTSFIRITAADVACADTETGEIHLMEELGMGCRVPDDGITAALTLDRLSCGVLEDALRHPQRPAPSTGVRQD